VPGQQDPENIKSENDQTDPLPFADPVPVVRNWSRDNLAIPQLFWGRADHG
jgi:hypothetical protein